MKLILVGKLSECIHYVKTEGLKEKNCTFVQHRRDLFGEEGAVRYIGHWWALPDIVEIEMEIDAMQRKGQLITEDA